jgi:hypothetical protein
MTTQFQLTLGNDRDTLYDIVKIFHPYIEVYDIGKIKSLLSIELRYDWVTVKLRYKNKLGELNISIGIENGNVQPMIYGGNKPMSVFEDALDNNQVLFRAWRFVDDILYNRESVFDENIAQVNRDLSNQVAELLKSRGYTVQSAKELFTIYHED